MVPIPSVCDSALERYREYCRDRIITTNLLMDVALGRWDRTPERGTRSADFSTDRVVVDSILWFRDRLELAVQRFQGGVWFDAGLQKFIQAQTRRSFSARYRDWHGSLKAPIYTDFEMDVRCTSLAGRFLITFEAVLQGKDTDPAPGTQVTFITGENERFHRMGYQSVYGKADDILKLCEHATLGWGQAHRAIQLMPGESIDFGLIADDGVGVL